MSESLLNIAYRIIEKSSDPMEFAKLWDAICTEADLSKEVADKKVARFYTNLSLDGRFANLGNNMWDLRSRHAFAQVHIDLKDVYADLDTRDTGDSDEVQEEQEYKKLLDDNKEEGEEEQTGDLEGSEEETDSNSDEDY